MFIPQHFVCIKKHTRKPTCVFSKSRLEFHLFPAVHPQNPANASSQKDRGQPGCPSRCEKSPLQHQRDTSDTTSEKQSTGSSQQSPLLPHQQRCRQTAQKHGRTHNSRRPPQREGPRGSSPTLATTREEIARIAAPAAVATTTDKRIPFSFFIYTISPHTFGISI